MSEDLLLTEIDLALIPGYVFEKNPAVPLEELISPIARAVAEAQLAHCKPLIEKQERERTRARLVNRLIRLPENRMRALREKPAFYIREEDLASLFPALEGATK